MKKKGRKKWEKKDERLTEWVKEKRISSLFSQVSLSFPDFLFSLWVRDNSFRATHSFFFPAAASQEEWMMGHLLLLMVPFSLYVWPVMKGNPFFACCLMCFCATVQSESASKKKPSPPSLLLSSPKPFTAAIHSVIQFSSEEGTPSSLNYLLPLIILSPETGFDVRRRFLETVWGFGRSKNAHSFPRFFSNLRTFGHTFSLW